MKKRREDREMIVGFIVLFLIFVLLGRGGDWEFLHLGLFPGLGDQKSKVLMKTPPGRKPASASRLSPLDLAAVISSEEAIQGLFHSNDAARLAFTYSPSGQTQTITGLSLPIERIHELNSERYTPLRKSLLRGVPGELALHLSPNDEFSARLEHIFKGHRIINSHINLVTDGSGLITGIESKIKDVPGGELPPSSVALSEARQLLFESFALRPFRLLAERGPSIALLTTRAGAELVWEFELVLDLNETQRVWKFVSLRNGQIFNEDDLRSE